MAAVALAAIAMWAALYATSPTRRLAGRLAMGSPAYERRDAAAMLGADSIPSWERRRAVNELIGVLDDPNTQVRVAALSGLHGRGADALPALPLVLRCAADPSSQVRFTASAVLGKLAEAAGPAERDAIRDALRKRLDDADPAVRVEAAEGLIPLDEDAALTAIVRAYDRPDEEMVGAMAHLALRRARSRSRRLVPILVREARHEDPARRLQMLDLIVELAPPEIVRAELRRAAADPDEGVRRSAAAKLEATELGVEAAPPPESQTLR
jgi:HEAT repeat protein